MHKNVDRVNTLEERPSVVPTLRPWLHLLSLLLLLIEDGAERIDTEENHLIVYIHIKKKCIFKFYIHLYLAHRIYVVFYTYLCD